MELLLVGGFIGFLSAIGKDYILEEKKNVLRQRDFKREKLEELFVIANKLFTENIKPIHLRSDSTDTLESSKLVMMIRFYFPSLKKYLDDYIKALGDVNMNWVKHANGEMVEVEVYVGVLSASYRKLVDKIVHESKYYQ